MRTSPGPSAHRAEGRSSRSTYHQRVADPGDTKPKKKLTAGAWEEARALVWSHRKRLGLGLSLMVQHRNDDANAQFGNAIDLAVDAGANAIVAGSAIFGSDDYAAAIARIRNSTLPKMAVAR